MRAFQTCGSRLAPMTGSEQQASVADVSKLVSIRGGIRVKCQRCRHVEVGCVQQGQVHHRPKQTTTKTEETKTTENTIKNRKQRKQNKKHAKKHSTKNNQRKPLRISMQDRATPWPSSANDALRTETIIQMQHSTSASQPISSNHLTSATLTHEMC